MSNTFIIAEAGVNHNGSLEIAKSLVDQAVAVGANAVKFQTFRADTLVNRNTQLAAYQKESTGFSSQYDMLKKLELSTDDHYVLFDYCKKQEIEFLSSPFDEDSVHFLGDLGVRQFKVPSGELINYPYLVAMAQWNRPTLLSTGMATLAEVEFAVNTLFENGLDRNLLTLLHANTAYPTPYEDANLRAMSTLRAAFQLPVGYSDHTLGIEVPIAAVALGATVIEKHFTLDTRLDGPDHKASLEPEGFKKMVKSIRNIELSLGGGLKTPSRSERNNMAVVRKVLVARSTIRAGDIFSNSNLTVKRANGGVSSIRWTDYVGRFAQKNYEQGEVIVE